MLPSSTAMSAAGKGPGRRLAALLAVAGLGYAAVLFSRDPSETDRLLQPQPERKLAGVGEGPPDPSVPEWDAGDSRLLALSAASPPADDEVPGEYVVKPWVGTAHAEVWETKADTKVVLSSAQASSTMGPNYTPRMCVDDPNLATRWASSKDRGDEAEWVNIDMGMPMTVAEVYIKWWEAYAVDYEIFVSRERPVCRPSGNPCPDDWMRVEEVTGKTDASATSDSFAFAEDNHALQGVRYLRIKLNQRAPGYENFSIYYIRVYRPAMVVGESSTGTSCAATVSAAAVGLLGDYGGALLQSFEHAEFFVASMTEAQKDAMHEDPCVFTVEPNYVVRARGKRAEARARRAAKEEEHRNLAIPEFNLKDESPANWGLERISSHGRLNGKYTWFHEGQDTHIYILDTGVYPDHSEWRTRSPGVDRIGEGLICAGAADDYDSNDHGTHVASLAAGFETGTAKSATIHPIQVLDANGEGSTASVLCGIDKLLGDGKEYNLANAPRKIRAVVNLSLGVDGRSDALDRAVKDMTNVGYTVVVAAGDHDGNACFYSPWDPTAIMVGALSNHPLGQNEKTATSNYGECIDVWAPGEDVRGATNTGEYDTIEKSGTSVASAMVAGAACLFFEEINTEEWELDEFAARVKEKILNKAEIDILEDIGHGSVNKVIQTTSSRCLQNSHCDTGLTCLYDGTCVDLSKPLKQVM